MGILLTAFDDQFRKIHDLNLELLRITPNGILFSPLHSLEAGQGGNSVGENILRSAAMVEMAFGGITTRLWDDPFEWTLPEELATVEKIVLYLDEVEVTRKYGFGFFASDTDLSKSIPSPRDLRPIGEILIETIARASHYQGRAFAIYHSIALTKLPRL